MKRLIIFLGLTIGLFLFVQSNQRLNISSDDIISKLQERLSLLNKLWPTEKIYIHTDRTFYQPGDDIWFSLYLRNGDTNKASEVSGIVYADLINPKGAVEKQLQLVAKEGRAFGDFTLGGEAPGGIYKIKSYTNWMKNYGEEYVFEKELQVQVSMLPNLLLKLEFEKESYGLGEEVSAEIEVKGLDGKPIKNNKLDYQVQFDGKKHEKGKAITDSNGKSILKFLIPKKLENPDGLLNIQITYEGVTESISRSVPVVLNMIDLQFFPEGGDMIANVSNRIAIKALNSHGKPADVQGYILNKSGEKVTEFKSYHQGMGVFDLVPESDEKYSAILTSPVGVDEQFALPQAKKSGYAMKVDNNPDGIKLQIHSPVSKHAILMAQINGNIHYSKNLDLTKGGNLVQVSASDFPTGIAQITLFDANGNPQCERLVFHTSSKKPNIEITTDKKAYQPREQVNMKVKVSDNSGLPLPTQLSLSVVDDKLLSFADDKQDNILSYMLLSSMVKGEIHEPSFYFDPKEKKATKALDYLLMTQGWRRFSWDELTKNNEHSLKFPSFEYQAEKLVLKGRVVRYNNEDPVGNVKVTVLDTEEYTFTDRQGRFSFSGLDLSTPVTLFIKNNNFERIISVNDYAQNYIIGGRVSGKVVDEEGNGLPGVNVIIKGKAIGTVTDIEGYYSMLLTENADILQYSYIGYMSEEVAINQRQDIDLTMVPDIQQLEEVVVVGYGATKDYRPARNYAPQKKKTERKVKQERPQIVEVDDNIEVDINLDIDLMEEVVFEDEEIYPEEEVEEIFMIVEQMPQYKGGMGNFYNYVKRNLNYPQKAIREGIEGKVFVQFVVEKDGSIQDVQVVRGLCKECDEAATEAIAQSANWKPGKQRGIPVATRMIVPIKFSLSEMIEIQDGLMFQIANQSHYGVKSAKPKYYKGREFYIPRYTSEPDEKERTDFRKTIFWKGDIITNNLGEASFSFYTSDEITNFRAIAEGITDNGEVLRKEHTFYTELPFNLSVKFPKILTYEDTLLLPVVLKNNTDEVIKGKLKVDLPEQVQLIHEYAKNISIEADSYDQQYVALVVNSIPGKAPIGISFRSDVHQDAIQDTIIVEPKGFPMTASYSNKILRAQYSISLEDVVPNSLRADVTAYPDVISDLMKGVESILREPYGCFEQASSTTYPNLIALRYLEETDQDNFQVRSKALKLIQKGYNKLVGYETKQDGYEWFGHTPPHEALTAYGLMEFTDMQHVYATVNPEMVSRTSDWLCSRRDGSGGFLQSGNGLDQFGRASKDVNDLYIIYALSEADNDVLTDELDKSYRKAKNNNDAYLLGLAANTMFNTNQTAYANDLVKKLQKMIDEHGFASLPTQHSITRSTGKSLQVETTSLILMALLKQPKKDLALIEEGVQFLIKSRNAYGGFGSTQATILALKAITSYAVFTKRTKESGVLKVNVNKERFGSLRYEKDALGELRISGIEEKLITGTNSVEVQFDNASEPLPYTLGIEWTTYKPPASKDCKVKLETKLSSSSVRFGKTVRLQANLVNVTAEGLPMTMALVGIPSGLSVQPWQLKELQEKKVFDFYELKDNYLILYYRDMAPNEECVINLDLKSEIPGVFKGPASSAYLYYTNEHKYWVDGERIEIPIN